jgi:cold shock CspA family protein
VLLGTIVEGNYFGDMTANTNKDSGAVFSLTMHRYRCDNCGEQFNSEYNFELHRDLDVCESESGDPGNSNENTEETQTREHVASDVTGTVYKFNSDRGFGFVSTSDLTTDVADDVEYPEDVFFHISEVMEDVDEGDRLRMEVYRTEEGLRGERISIVERDVDSKYNPPERDRSSTLGFGDESDDIRRGHKPGPTESDIENFADERKFR